jgi:hypothetical protein
VGLQAVEFLAQFIEARHLHVGCLDVVHCRCWYL